MTKESPTASHTEGRATASHTEVPVTAQADEAGPSRRTAQADEGRVAAKPHTEAPVTAHADDALAPVWAALYPDHVDADPDLPWESLAHAWTARVEAAPDQTAILYRGTAMSTTEVDADAEALAAGFLDRGAGRGTIIGIRLQNVPQFAIALLAAWKIGAVPLVLNPMYRGRELRALIDDSRATGLICDESDAEAVTSTLAGSSLSWVLTTTDSEYAPADDILGVRGRPEDGSDDDRAATATANPSKVASATATANPTGDASATPDESATPDQFTTTELAGADPGPAIAVTAWSDVLSAHRATSASTLTSAADDGDPAPTSASGDDTSAPTSASGDDTSAPTSASGDDTSAPTSANADGISAPTSARTPASVNHRADLLPRLDDPALLTYTSGTTGPAKGSVATHRNVLSVAQGCGRWFGLVEGDVMLAVAPLFHITGAVACAATSLIFPVVLDFVGRVDADAIVTAVREDGVTVTIGSITVFNALLEHSGATSADFESIRLLYSGGAPVPPATVERFRERFGHYIHNIYGMTETASAVIGVPPHAEAPVDPATDTLAIGVPFPGLNARIVDVPAGHVLTDGTAGELELRGPQVTPGYLNKPEANAQAFDDGWLRTGDVAVMDAAGWIYLVDRIKDQINVSGYKVWPREVEDALYEHPAVLEAAVVGQPDDYRGETVVAYVSLRAGQTATSAELIAFTRDRLAAYKYPRIVHIIADLPKTHTGKIQRRLLRDSGAEAVVADPTAPPDPSPTSSDSTPAPATEETP